MRYERQLMIPQIGQKGQDKLKKSTVTVIGTGGLGSPVLTYLTAAGVGSIRIFDCGAAIESDLNRQFLHKTEDIGKLKVLSAKEKLAQLNPEVNLVSFNRRLTPDNMEEFIAGSDVVVDCVDNVETRVSAAKACMKLDIPLVEGGVNGFRGFLMDIGRDSACLSCLGYDREEPVVPIPVLGAMAGVIGSMQANECIKLLLGIGRPYYGCLLSYDGLSGIWEETSVEKAECCPVHSKISG